MDIRTLVNNLKTNPIVLHTTVNTYGDPVEIHTRCKIIQELMIFDVAIQRELGDSFISVNLYIYGEGDKLRVFIYDSRVNVSRGSDVIFTAIDDSENVKITEYTTIAVHELADFITQHSLKKNAIPTRARGDIMIITQH